MYLKGRNFRRYLFSQVEKMHFAGIYIRELILFFAVFLLISLFYTDFDGISEKSTFCGYLISQNQQKFAKLAKISTRKQRGIWFL